MLVAGSSELAALPMALGLSALTPVSRLPSKTFTLTDPENFFLRVCNLADRGDKSGIPASFGAD